jgi:hypothetical protein
MMKVALAAVLCVSAFAGAATAAPVPVPAPIPYRGTLTGVTGAAGGATAYVIDSTGLVALQVRLLFDNLNGGMTGASFHFTDTGTDLPATVSLPGLPIGEDAGAYEQNFYLMQPNRPLFSPEYVSRYGTSAGPFLDLLQDGALSMVIETGAYPAGEIRGTLTADPSPVPLPPALAPMLLALAGLGAASLRRSG